VLAIHANSKLSIKQKWCACIHKLATLNEEAEDLDQSRLVLFLFQYLSCYRMLLYKYITMQKAVWFKMVEFVNYDLPEAGDANPSLFIPVFSIFLFGADIRISTVFPTDVNKTRNISISGREILPAAPTPASQELFKLLHPQAAAAEAADI
jgi:hypothetical protein